MKNIPVDVWYGEQQHTV